MPSDLASDMFSLKLGNDDGAARSSEEASASTGGEDPELWKPHGLTEECPLCFVPLPLDEGAMCYNICCGKTICGSCRFEIWRAELAKNVTDVNKLEMPTEEELDAMKQSCAFCRTVNPQTLEEDIERFEKKIREGDGRAATNLGIAYRIGALNFSEIPKDEAKCLQYFHLAADDLGSPQAMTELGSNYARRDDAKAREYLERAVRLGYVNARCLLGTLDMVEGKPDLALRHWTLAAKAGDPGSMRQIWKAFNKELITKTDLESLLRSHKKACDEMNSEERERARVFSEIQQEKFTRGNEVDDTLQYFLMLYYAGRLSAKELELNLKARGFVNYRKAK